MCFKYKLSVQVALGEMVTHPFNVLTNFQQHTPSPEHIKPLLLPLTARRIGTVCEY